MNWKAFNNQKKEIDIKNAKTGSFLKVYERKIFNFQIRFQGKKQQKSRNLGKSNMKNDCKEFGLMLFSQKKLSLWLLLTILQVYIFPKLWKNQTWNTKGKDENFFFENAFWIKRRLGAMLLVTAKHFWITFCFLSNFSKTTECVKFFERKTSGNGICVRPCPQGTSKIGRLWQIQTINIVVEAAKPTMFKPTSQKKTQNFRFRRWRQMWSQYLWKKMTCNNDKISRTSAFCSAFLLDEEYNTRNKT